MIYLGMTFALGLTHAINKVALRAALKRVSLEGMDFGHLPVPPPPGCSQYIEEGGPRLDGGGVIQAQRAFSYTTF